MRISSCHRYPHYLSVIRETLWMSPFYIKEAYLLSFWVFFPSNYLYGERHCFDTAEHRDHTYTCVSPGHLLSCSLARMVFSDFD